MGNLKFLKEGWRGMLVAVLIGILAFFIEKKINSGIFDPLFAALVIGIVLRSIISFDNKYAYGFKIAPMLLVPIGIVLYGAINLDFIKFSQVEPMVIFIMLFTFLGNATFIFFLSTLLNIKPQITYLITAGSAICGASAITITSNAVDAEPDDVSNSLMSVFLTAIFGLFILLPFIGVSLKMSGVDYGIMSGLLLQFSGFVKESIVNIPVVADNASAVMSLATTVKAVRYLGLLIFIPLFSSLAKKKFNIPWYLWAFLAAGIIFSFFPYLKNFNPILKPTLTFLWSTAMAAIGLNANLKVLFSKTGAKVLIVTLISFLFAVGIFLGMYIPLRELMS